MRVLLFTLLLSCGVFAAGGDTLTFPNSVNTLADGDTFYTELHYAPLRDSIRSVINGRLGNANLATDAAINGSKIDSTSNIKVVRLDADTAVIDSVVVNKLHVDTSATLDSLHVNRAIDVDTIYANPALQILDVPFQAGASPEIRLGDSANYWKTTYGGQTELGAYYGFKINTFGLDNAINIGQGGDVDINATLTADSVFSNAGIVGTTVNTGSGDFEIGQNLRTTDDVTFDSIYATKLELGTAIDLSAVTVSVDSLFSTKGFQGTLYGPANAGTGTNTINGYGALGSRTTADDNVANGYLALSANQSGWQNIAIGSYALQNTLAGVNIGIGRTCLQNNENGSGNVGIGRDVMQADSFPSNNVAVGNFALGITDSSNSNVAVGVQTLYNGGLIENLTLNTAIGYRAGYGTGHNFCTYIGPNLSTTRDSTFTVNVAQIRAYADSASAYADGIRSGNIYRVGSDLKIMY